jgi:hypothetical protein
MKKFKLRKEIVCSALFLVSSASCGNAFVREVGGSVRAAFTSKMMDDFTTKMRNDLAAKVMSNLRRPVAEMEMEGACDTGGRPCERYVFEFIPPVEVTAQRLRDEEAAAQREWGAEQQYSEAAALLEWGAAAQQAPEKK